MPSPFTIVAFGDSMTECKALEPSARWPGLLQRRLNRASAGIRCVVVNAGVGGNTSREGLARLERDVLPHRPDLTLVQFGGNDATPDDALSPAGRSEQFASFQSDAPSCDRCGMITVRNGNCYLCHNCGNSMGCS